jgi:hypothetical protein
VPAVPAEATGVSEQGSMMVVHALVQFAGGRMVVIVTLPGAEPEPYASWARALVRKVAVRLRRRKVVRILAGCELVVWLWDV